MWTVQVKCECVHNFSITNSKQNFGKKKVFYSHRKIDCDPNLKKKKKKYLTNVKYVKINRRILFIKRSINFEQKKKTTSLKTKREREKERQTKI